MGPNGSARLKEPLRISSCKIKQGTGVRRLSNYVCRSLFEPDLIVSLRTCRPTYRRRHVLK